MSIAARIYLGMVSMITLVLVVGAVSVFLTSGLAGTFDAFQTKARTNLLAAELRQNVSEMRLAAMKYRQAGDPRELDRISQKATRINAIFPDFENTLDGYNEQTGVKAFPGMIGEYADLMVNAGELQSRLTEQLTMVSEVGLSADESLARLISAALPSNTVQMDAAAIKSDLLQGRLHLERYLASRDQADFQASADQTSRARLQLNQVLGGSDRESRVLAEATLEDTSRFESAASEIFEALNSLETLYARLDEIGPQALALIDLVFAEAVERQETLSLDGSQTAQKSITTISTLVVLGTVAGLLLAFLTVRTVSRSLSKVTNDMTMLAEGNLDIEIDAAADNHEIGKITAALAVFQENGYKAQKLDADIKKAERSERERLENEERQREAELAEQKMLEQEARDADRKRMDTLESFQKEMERVMDQAASGNFSVRMSEKIEDKNLSTLAAVVNRLLQTTETNISDIVKSIGELAKGNLGVRIEGSRQGVFLAMKDDFNASLDALSETMARILESGKSVSLTSLNLSNSSKNMSARAEDNAATVEETSAAVEEITASIRQVVANAKAADEATRRVRQSADETRKVSTETEASINTMTDASAQINRVVKVIEDIAFQINLLALNAGVEAARAGEAGLGFSVVASEVRALALRSQEAVQEITKVIEQSNLSVEAGVQQVGLSRKALEGIIQEVEVASEQISEIASAVEEQAKGIEEVNTAVRTIDVNAQKNAATLEEMTASSQAMSKEADLLSAALGEFQGISHKLAPAERPKTPAFQKKTAPRPRPEIVAVSGSAAVNDSGWEEF